jgi:uracil-xanthine permease
MNTKEPIHTEENIPQGKRGQEMEKKETKAATPYELDGRPPLGIAIPLGLQHVLAMFVGNLTPLLIITGACGIESGGDLQVALLQNAMLVAGIVTLVQVFTIGPVGGKLPIVMGTSSGFIGVCRSVAGVMGNSVAGYGAILAASFIGGLFETVLGGFLKPLRKFFPSVVTGTVVLSIGLSLISVGIASFGGGSSAKDYGSLENLFVGMVVLIVIIALKHGTKGFTSFSSILLGIIAGYVLVTIMALILPTTFTYVDESGATVEATKAWVLNWQKVADASWFAIPKIMPVKWVFDARAIVPICIMFVVTAVETVGDISGITEGGLGREATDKELSGGVMCDGLGSAFAALFGVLPNTSFSQNVGLVAMNKVVNRFCIGVGGVFLIACGLFPKLAALISIMPQSVLGGAAVMMFASIVVSGIQLITKWPVTPRNVTIVSVALGLGYGLGANTAVLAQLPEAINLIFGGSGIVPAALFAILLNIVLPPDEKSEVEIAEEILAEKKNEQKK